jgi:hypothetical protein
MGLDYSYLLFFKKEVLRGVLEHLADMTQPSGFARTMIHFPDGGLVLPLITNQPGVAELQYDAPELHLAATFLFSEDGAIREYLGIGDLCNKHSSLLSDNQLEKEAIGLIYLSVIQDLSSFFQSEISPEVMLLNFKTTGSRMSILFQESYSIRRTFTEILKQFQGLAGAFDYEQETLELFWLDEKLIREGLLGKSITLDDLKDLVSSMY